MANPIDNGPRVPRHVVGDTNTQRAGRKETETAATKQQGETAARGSDASMESDRLKSVRQAIDSASGFDSARVDEIKQRLADGEYPVDAERVADRLTEFERLLSE
jgi:negative regulator of flagellin synthesis FlgM